MLRIGTQSDIWYSELDPDNSIAYYKSCGFDTIDFNLHQYIKCGELKDMEPPFSSFYDKPLDELYEYFAPLKEACRKHGVTIAQIHAPFSSWYEGKDAFNEYMIGVHEKCIAISAFLDCPGIVIHPVHGLSGYAEWDVNSDKALESKIKIENNSANEIDSNHFFLVYFSENLRSFPQ